MSKIIIIGSESDDRDVLAWMLDLGGYRCDIADSLSEAVTLLHEEPFDLCLADNHLYGSMADFLVDLVKTVWPKLRVAILARKDETPSGKFPVLAFPCCPEQLYQFIDQALGNSLEPANSVG